MTLMPTLFLIGGEGAAEIAGAVAYEVVAGDFDDEHHFSGTLCCGSSEKSRCTRSSKTMFEVWKILSASRMKYLFCQYIIMIEVLSVRIPEKAGAAILQVRICKGSSCKQRLYTNPFDKFPGICVIKSNQS
jgi:hypothetical protein